MTKIANRNKVKMWFITFPHSGSYTPEIFCNTLFNRERCITGVAGVQETHDDGEPHIHLNVKLEFPLTKSQILNSCRIKFPNDYKRIDLRPTRQRYDKADYLHKEGNVFFWERPNIRSRAVRRNFERGCREVYESFKGIFDDWLLDTERTLSKFDETGICKFWFSRMTENGKEYSELEDLRN